MVFFKTLDPTRTAALCRLQVFLQKSAVNLLSSVLGTPEFFWHAPDRCGGAGAAAQRWGSAGGGGGDGGGGGAGTWAS